MTLTTSTDYRIKTLTLAVSADPAPCHTKFPPREGGEKAERLVRSVQNFTGRMMRVFKKEGGREREDGEEPEAYMQSFDSVLIWGKDQTRGEYKVKGVGTMQGGKIVKGRKFEERVLRTIKKGDGRKETWLRKEPSERRSKWVMTQGRKWLQYAQLMAKGQTREKGKCQECGEESTVHQRKVELCIRCNRKVFSWEHMRKVEGFMLLSWILVECRGREWMGQMLLNKKRWQEWEMWLQLIRRGW